MPKESRFILSLQAAAQIWQLFKSCQIYSTGLNHRICQKKVDLWVMGTQLSVTNKFLKMSLNRNWVSYKILSIITLLLLFLRFGQILIVQSAIINELILILTFGCLLLLLLKSISLSNPFLKLFSTFATGISCLIVLVCIPYGFFGIISKDKGILECINELKCNNQSIKVYRKNGGATTDFGVMIREEKQILPRLLYVRTLFDKYHLDTIGIKVVEKNKLQILDVKNNDSIMAEITIGN